MYKSLAAKGLGTQFRLNLNMDIDTLTELKMDHEYIDTTQYRWADRNTLEKCVETPNGWTWVKVETTKENKNNEQNCINYRSDRDGFGSVGGYPFVEGL